MEFNIADHTHYLVISGSYAYGTYSESSDYDLRGWAIPPKQYFTTFDKHFEQNDQGYPYIDYPFRRSLAAYIETNHFRVPPNHEVIDHSIYGVLKFFALAAECNPNVIELLFVEPSDVLYTSHLGTMVREHRDLFLSARAKHTFTGYAVSQLKRINTHRKWLLNPPKAKPERAEYGLPETSVIPPEQRGAAEALVEAKVRNWLLQDAELSDSLIAEIHEKLTDLLANVMASKDLIARVSDENDLRELARISAMRNLGMTENYIAVLQSEKKYRDRLKEWNQYNEWVEKRNPARAELEAKYGYDTKHGMQLVRLLLNGKELLTTGKLTVKRDDVSILRDIRNGGWSYEKIISYLDAVDKELQDIYNNKRYAVPHKPDMNGLSKLCNQVVGEAVFT